MFNQDLSQEEIKALKSELNLTEDSKVLVYIGRISKEKNLDELLDFLPDLISRDGNIKLILCGVGPRLKHLKNKVKKLGLSDNVEFTGVIHPDDTYKYYKIGDIFVSPSRCETQGITYMEALASSLPLVCRYDESLDDVIQSGFNGFTYRSKEEFIDNVIRVFEMKNEDYESYIQLKNNAFKSSFRFSKGKFGEEMEKLYLKILEMRS